MLNLALTGNIASGKSTVAELFRRWGAVVIDADQIVREAQAPGTPVLAAIVRRFGNEILHADGSLDRGRLRARVLADPAELEALNAIMHPEVQRVRERLLRDAEAAGAQVVINDIPLLFEAADPDAFDGVILVDSPAEVRRLRLLERSDLPPHEADRLIAAQLPSGLKRARATWVIDNDRDLAWLESEAARVWALATGGNVP